ncbi:MFS transporter [Rathayibacter toxicus]|nr:MFS transporter [Rathayibacter toxicus]
MASVLFVELGSAILMIGLPLFVLQRYGLALDGALAIGFRYLPGVIVGPWLNYTTRRISPKIVASTATAGIAIVALLIPATNQLWQVHLLSVILGIFTTVDVPARLAMRSWVTSRGTEQRLNSLIVTTERIAITVGPLLAASIGVFAGVEGNFSLQALLAAPAILTLLFVPRPTHSGEPRPYDKRRRAP